MVIDLKLISNGGNATPEQLPIIAAKVAALAVPAAQGGVILSGRAPVWAFGAMIHAAHPAAWVATFDPRLGGGVVVQTHTPDRKVGEVVPLEGHEVAVIEI